MAIIGKTACLVCFFATVFDPVVSDGQCASPQFAEISQDGKIECVVPSTFSAVVWYDSTNTANSQIARIERQRDGSLRTSGTGVDSGSYIITDEGSLTIPVVTTQHDRNFTVLIFDENYEVSSSIVELITVVYSDQSLPAVNSCGENFVCMETVKRNATLSCTFEHARPPVRLAWYKFNRGKFRFLEATQYSYSKDNVSFSTVLDTKIFNLTENLLNVFSCRAYGPAVRVEQAATDILVLVQNMEIGNHGSCHTEIKEKNVFVDSVLEIPCTDKGRPYSFIWQFANNNHSKILMFSINGTEKFLNEMSMPMYVSKDGSLLLPHVDWTSPGIYTCFFLVDGFSDCTEVEIKVERASASVWLILCLVIVALVTSVTIGVGVFVWRKNIIVKTFVKMADAIKYFPFETIEDSKIFEDDAINLLRNVSKEIEENRKKKNLGVILGSAVGIAAGGLTILGTALLPFTFGGSVGLAVAGAAAGAAGAGLSIGFSLEKLINDKNRMILVKPALEAFISIQKDLAEIVVWLSISYQISTSRKYKKCLSKKIMEISESFLRDLLALHTGEGDSFPQMFSKLKTKAKELVNIAFEPDVFTEEQPLDSTHQWERYLQEDSESPFDYLEEAVLIVLQKQKELKNTPTLFTFIKKLYASDATATDCNIEVNEDAANYVQGGLTAGRVAVNVVGLTDDAARVGANVGKIAKGVSVAGIVLSAVGIVVDLVFLGHAVRDLLSKAKEQFSQALLDTADVMEKMNSIAFQMYSMNKENLSQQTL